MKLTLRVKIVVITITIIILSISANSVINSVIFVNEYTDALGEKAFAAGQSLKIQLDRLLKLNIPLHKLVGFEKQCSDLVNRYDGILYAMVLDTKNIILFHNDMSQRERRLHDIPKPNSHPLKQKLFELKNEASKTIYQSRIPIIDSHKEYQGMLIIGFSDKIIKAKRNRMIFASGVVGVLSVAFAICLVIALIHFIVSQPLNTFISDIQSIRSSKADELQLIKSQSNDEIGQLKEAFNDLMTDLNASNNKVKKYTEKLESEIQARTAELTIANQNLQRDMIVIRKAEKALKKSESKYRSMMESMTDPVYICSPDFKVEYMNPAMLNRLGRNATGEPCHSAIHGMNEKCEWCIFDKDEKIESIETTVLSPLDKRNYRLTYMPILHEDGTVSKMSIFRDITDFLIAVEEKEKAKAQLLQSQKMESIGTLAGGIAHEFNNILGIIIGNTELATNDVPEWNPAKECLKEIRTASLRAKEVVRQILGFARKSVFQLQPVQIGTIIRKSLKLIRASIPATIEIRQNLSCKSDTVMADPTQIGQVLMNLCTNAKNAMQEEGGVLEVKLEDTILDEKSAIRYEDLSPGNYVKLTVKDTGHGIDPKIIDRIFDPYFTTTSLAEGTGMGLAVVHGIVKRHKGAIRVESEPGKGAVFEVLFLLSEAEAKQETKKPEALPTGSERILFVDDDGSLVKIGQKMLNQFGYDVETKRNPIEALDLIRSEPDRFDLVITDMTMPQMTGDKLAKEILSIRPDMPIILCTGFSEKIDDEKAQALGIRKYIEKPFIQSKFAIAIRNVLN